MTEKKKENDKDNKRNNSKKRKPDTCQRKLSLPTTVQHQRIKQQKENIKSKTG